MSDFFRKQPELNPQYNRRDAGNDEWGASAYSSELGGTPDAYPDAPEGPGDGFGDMGGGANGEDLYSAWRRPGGANFLDDDPTPFGAEMQQGGVPLFNAERQEDDFRSMGDNAPTRIAPAVQRVSRRTTVSEGGPAAPSSAGSASSGAERFAAPDFMREEQPRVATAAPVDAAPAPRRRSRMDRARTEAARQPSVQEQASPFDPFSAGDSEMASKTAAQSGTDADRRTAQTGGRYVGARTAMPAGGVAAKAQAVRDELKQSQSGGDVGTQQPKRPTYWEDNRPVPRQPAAPARRPMASEYPEYREETDRPAPRQNGAPARRVAAQPYGEDIEQPAPRPAAPRQPGMPARRPVAQEYGEDIEQPAPRPAAPRQPGMPARRPVAQEYGEDINRPAPRQNGAPVRRPISPEYGEEDARPGQRPVPPRTGAPARRPAQEGVNRQPQAGGAYARPQTDAADQSAYAYRAQQTRSPYEEEHGGQRGAVKRKPYDFETENENAPRRKGGALVPIVVVLLVLGGLLAGVCLPDWANMGGKVGETILPVKTAVVSMFAKVKNMVMPEEDPIKSFTVSASGSTAPVTVRLMAQTSKNIAGLRIADDKGNDVYSATYSDQLILTNEVVENSNVLIWQPVCTMDTEYSGGFTAYVTKKDGTESEGFRAANTVEIAAPKPALPPVQSFTIDTESSAVPVDVIFAVVTSTDVAAVRVVDQYKSPVATMSVEDVDNEQGTMTENGDVRTWTLNAEITADYAGSYAVQYRTDGDALNYTDSDYSVSARFASDLPDDESVGTGEEMPPAENGSVIPQAALQTSQTMPESTVAVAANAAVATDAPTAAPTQAPTTAPTAAPTPTPKPTAAPTLAPDSTPLPILNAQASDSASPLSDDLKLKAVLLSNGKTVQTFNRTNAISLLNPFTTYAGGSDYAIWKQAGVLTFRSGPLRQNAAYGTVEVKDETLTQVWNQPIGSMKVSNDTLYGVNAPGQALIVKWPTEVRQRMGILAEARDVTALKEVIVAGQDGKIYFYNLLDGTPSRDPIDLGAPSAGGLSIATNGTPILGVGQSHSKLSSKTVKSGYHLINLLSNKEEMLIQTDGKEKNSNYTGVLGAALFDSKTGAMIFGSQGGVLYTAELGKQTEAYDYQAGKVSLSSTVQAYKTTVKGQDKKNTNIDGSVAMYNNYVYYGDQAGVVQCVNVNDLTTVWAVQTGDNVDATPALDMDDENTVALYTGTTILLQRKNGACTLRRLNALTGEEDWSYQVPDIAYSNDYEIGLEASPVVGQENISDLVIFTVTNGAKGSMTLALNKKNGNVEWQTDFAVETVSSPVAVYNEAGDAWIVQALGDGQINLMDGRTGEVLDTLALGVKIKASPAVYGNLLVIGATGNDKGGVCCIKID